MAAFLGLGCRSIETFTTGIWSLETSHSRADPVSPSSERCRVNARSTTTGDCSPSVPAPGDPVPSRNAEDEDAAPLLSRTELLAQWNVLRGDGYALDAIDRFVEPSRSRRVRCAPENMVSYRGEAVRYQSPVTVNPVFRERLRRFELVVAEVATEVYGRPPRRIQHYGAYSCRTSRNRSHRLSEHALGNAIDVVGFDFGPLSRKESSFVNQPKRLRGPFVVTIARHWGKAGDPVAEQHARFLRTLTERLLERDDVFRGFVGPGYPGHDDHLHFDVAPWRYVRL
jgi:hypothetical protein